MRFDKGMMKVFVEDREKDLRGMNEKTFLNFNVTKSGFGSNHYLAFLKGDKTGPYYEVYEDTDTECITFYEKEGEKNENVMGCFSGFPYGARTITEAILADMKDRGYTGYAIIDPPWGEGNYNDFF